MSSRRVLQRLAATWGNGDFGRLGHGVPGSSEEVPRVVAALADLNVRQVAAGGAHTVVLADNGSVWSMGLNDFGQLGHSGYTSFVPIPQEVHIPEPIQAVAAGHYHTLCLSQGGDVWAFGLNAKGQLGLGDTGAGEERDPHRIQALSGAGVVGVAAGAEHSMAVTGAGELYTWGSADHGRLGHKEFAMKFWGRQEVTPRLVRALAGVRVRSAAAGHMHSGAVDDEGYVYTWGNGRFWQLGHAGSSEEVSAPEQVPDLKHVSSLALGGMHCLALRHGGDVMVWGANQNGLLGLGKSGQQSVRSPTAIPNLFCSQVSAGWKHSGAVTGDERLLTWGWGGSMGTPSAYEQQSSSGGQLGHGNDFDYWAPTQVQELCQDELNEPLLRQPVGDDVSGSGSGSEFGEGHSWSAAQVSCGFNHTAAVVEVEVDAEPAAS